MASYAVNLYKYFQKVGGYANGKTYRLRKERYGDCFDRGILLAVSKNLGIIAATLPPTIISICF